MNESCVNTHNAPMRDSFVAEKNQLDVIKPLAKEKFIFVGRASRGYGGAPSFYHQVTIHQSFATTLWKM